VFRCLIQQTFTPLDLFQRVTRTISVKPLSIKHCMGEVDQGVLPCCSCHGTQLALYTVLCSPCSVPFGCQYQRILTLVSRRHCCFMSSACVFMLLGVVLRMKCIGLGSCCMCPFLCSLISHCCFVLLISRR
jgi:hypothetical protein